MQTVIMIIPGNITYKLSNIHDIHAALQSGEYINPHYKLQFPLYRKEVRFRYVTAQKERQLPAFALLRDPSMRCSNAYVGVHELLPGSEECREKCLQEVVSYASSCLTIHQKHVPLQLSWGDWDGDCRHVASQEKDLESAIQPQQRNTDEPEGLGGQGKGEGGGWFIALKVWNFSLKSIDAEPSEFEKNSAGRLTEPIAVTIASEKLLAYELKKVPVTSEYPVETQQIGTYHLLKVETQHIPKLVTVSYLGNLETVETQHIPERVTGSNLSEVVNASTYHDRLVHTRTSLFGITCSALPYVGISPSSLAPDSGSDSNAEVLVAATLVHPKLCVDKILSKLPSESIVAQALKSEVGPRGRHVVLQARASEFRTSIVAAATHQTRKRKIDSCDGVDADKENIKISLSHASAPTIKRICREKTGTEWQTVLDVVEYDKEQQRKRTKSRSR
ncbi:hypothetical protein EDD22DRAFT_853027 [Suillus occidentalis]|nr:hypothetical protein EDD22DRAFT_853027 [Suillus occidentalis]